LLKTLEFFLSLAKMFLIYYKKYSEYWVVTAVEALIVESKLRN